MPRPAGSGLERNAPGEILHASSVAFHGAAVLILGASGSGKSSLALQLMALGAELVSDDRTIVHAEGNDVIVHAPETIRGQIEARGVGILNAEAHGPAPVRLVIDLDQQETARLPELRVMRLLGQSVPLLHAAQSPHFAASVLQMLACGRIAP